MRGDQRLRPQKPLARRPWCVDKCSELLIHLLEKYVPACHALAKKAGASMTCYQTDAWTPVVATKGAQEPTAMLKRLRVAALRD